MQNCPGNTQSVFQSSSASEDDDDEAEYQSYRHKAPVLPHWPPLEQIITDTRGALDDDNWRPNVFENHTPALNPIPVFRFREIKYKQEPQA